MDRANRDCSALPVAAVEHLLAFRSGETAHHRQRYYIASREGTLLASGLPTTNLGRIAIAVSPTSPQTHYAMLADLNNLKGFYASSNGGANWSPISAAAGVVEAYGPYICWIMAAVLGTPVLQTYWDGPPKDLADRLKAQWRWRNAAAAGFAALAAAMQAVNFLLL